jgi:hypothetical protein
MVVSSEESAGREVRVYDDARLPREWPALLTPSQCAVFFKRINSEISLLPDGTSVARFRDCTFLCSIASKQPAGFARPRLKSVPTCAARSSTGKEQPRLRF